MLAFPAVESLLQLDAVPSASALSSLSWWFEDANALSSHAVTSLCLAVVQRLPSLAHEKASLTELLRYFRIWFQLLFDRSADPAGSADVSDPGAPSSTSNLVRAVGLFLLADVEEPLSAVSLRGAALDLAAARAFRRFVDTHCAHRELATACAGDGAGADAAEVGITLRSLLSRRATKGAHRTPESSTAWAAAGGAVALIHRCPVDTLRTDFALLRSQHALPSNFGTMRVFYPRQKAVALIETYIEHARACMRRD
eukprot:gnl/TRDRNA2_/TRDRNA2_163598_c1_seq4.p1 gnl/TRDRNA2_/TRDRNA2_163598_c1~~gnl/TRDRNA2_/TRDRNA2_163598_c1_seq4.p1  ORF type:complete len:273 (-),score=20.82 gnl/TRDRNA2_/TRDRNA2_163598_c1_seq4:18-782(-)